MNALTRVAGGALLIYVAIVLAIAVIPAIQLSQVPPGPGVEPLTPLQEQGRMVFAANGCSYCHTQQVRPLPEDRVFGRPSAPGDFAWQTPELLGSARTGPDLTNVGTTKPSDVWQYIHLYDPRAVVPESIMPNFRFLFRVVDELPPGATAVPLPPGFGPAHGQVIPTEQARALVAYLLSLKQPAIPGYSPPSEHAAMAAPASAAGGAAPATAAYQYDAAKGAALYASNCAACHQATGQGIANAFPPLAGNAAVNAADPTLHIHTILDGAHGTVIGGVTYSGIMPPFASQLSDTDIADIVNFERSSWGNQAQPVTPAAVAAARTATK